MCQDDTREFARKNNGNHSYLQIRIHCNTILCILQAPREHIGYSSRELPHFVCNKKAKIEMYPSVFSGLAAITCLLAVSVFYLGCPNQQWRSQRPLRFYPALFTSLLLVALGWSLFLQALSALSASLRFLPNNVGSRAGAIYRNPG